MANNSLYGFGFPTVGKGLVIIFQRGPHPPPHPSQLQAHLHVNKKLDLILSPPQICTEVNSIVACFKALFLFRMYTPALPFISPRKTLYEVL